MKNYVVSHKSAKKVGFLRNSWKIIAFSSVSKRFIKDLHAFGRNCAEISLFLEIFAVFSAFIEVFALICLRTSAVLCEKPCKSRFFWSFSWFFPNSSRKSRVSEDMLRFCCKNCGFCSKLSQFSQSSNESFRELMGFCCEKVEKFEKFVEIVAVFSK